ncbi:RiPP maturation radical SAM C-methyltransferase [Nitrospirillum sp. BR 11163]|uniref:RiPP maturation radical SAM C-methyltransferase n=1 Tax=Nitrospirillum sp. BR 11163 TaxID=3104323 RepID=UPI002AFEFB74|nr:RiPP maturation radical SAM C-methyltransferase [Nitrospirillum sp. BR 11163]MEA1671954.1 RiPP maturation radical SAM C-methyltransferase [Nitrospirillum sp. BR 11163]
MSKEKRILFVVMPWHSLHLPSLASGLLIELTRNGAPAWRAEALYANILWAEYLETATGGRIPPDKYTLLGEDFFFQATGEWIFSSALYGVSQYQVDRYRDAFQGDAASFELALEAQSHAPGFIDQMAQRIAQMDVDVIGLSSVFQQNIPCLALARRLKEIRPALITIMGGANCDGVQGPALHRNFPCLDFVISGEADYSYLQFLRHVDGEIPAEDVAGLSWRRGDGHTASNPPGPLPQGEDFVVPMHDHYFDQIQASPMNRHIEPNIVAESARGCWWGQKHHCTFCGLNGMGMSFRSKPADQFMAEIEYLVRRHRSLDVVLADNILEMSYLKTFIPEMSAKNWDVRLHYEIKGNLNRAQLTALRDAGVWHIQPGIESLSTNVLRLMRKGITGPQNVRLLRECEELNLTTTWNILAGFPGETDQDYRAVQHQIPALAHLQPPSGATRLALERFSPFFDDLSLGFVERRPALPYAIAYGLPEAELMDIVYIFDDGKYGVADDVIDDMQAAVVSWKDAYLRGSTLTWSESRDGILIEDRRHGWPPRDHMLASRLERNLHALLDRPMKRQDLAQRAAAMGEGRGVVDALVGDWLDKGLVFEDAGVVIALATRPIPFRLRLAA